MAVSFQRFQSFSPGMQRRYVNRYGRPPRGFTPFKQPTSPPVGTFDPALDQQYRASQRGFNDLFAQINQDPNAGDLGVQPMRAQDDYQLQLGRLGEQYGNTSADIATSRAREGENYGQAIGTLDRNYAQLANRQAQAANQAGVVSGGALAQALAKRRANRVIEQQPIDTQHQRTLADLGTQQQRLDAGYGEQRGDLGLTLQRQDEDWTTQLANARRELTQFGLDTNESKFAQAAQAGFVPPQKPANEFSRRGVTYRRVSTPQGRRYMLPSGRLLTIQGLRRRYT